MVEEEGEVREAPHAQTRAALEVPTSCPICQRPVQKRTFVNGTTEVRCVQTEPSAYAPAHGFTLYVKLR